MLMFVVCHWVEGSFMNNVVCYAIFYGGLSQFIAGNYELIKGNSFAGTAFCSYGAFWLAFAILKVVVATAPESFSADYKVGETLFCVAWGFFTASFFVVTLRKNLALATVFGTLTITFFLLAGGVWSAATNLAAGYIGFICGMSAIYTAFAELWQEHLGFKMPGLQAIRYI